MTIIDEAFISQLKQSLDDAAHSEPGFETYEQESQKAFDRIVLLSSYRDRSSYEMRERLLGEDYSPESVSSAIQRCLDCGIIDDLRYADMLVRSRVSAGRGAYGIEHELEVQGICVSALEGWPYSYDCSDEQQIDRALAFLEKKPPRAKDAWRAAYRKLVGKGYSPSVCTKAARIWAESL